MAGTNKWALITGVSTGGLGDALAKELLLNNIKVIITGLQL
jgi:short-subunit dehydrogenase